MANVITPERHEGSKPNWTGGDHPDNAYSDTPGSGVIGNVAATHPGWGNFAKRITRQGPDWDAYRRLSFSAISTKCFWTWEKEVLAEALSDGQQVVLAALRDVSDGDVVRIYIRQTAAAGTFFRAAAKEAGDGGGYTNHDGPSISAGTSTRYRIAVLYDFDNALWRWYVDGVLIDEVTGITPATEIDQVQYGTTAADTQSAYSFEYDRLAIDDEAWPEYAVPHIATGANTSLTIAGAEVGALIDNDRQPELQRNLGGDPDMLNLALLDQENRVAYSEELDRVATWLRQNIDSVTQDDGPHGADEAAFIIVEDATASVTHRLREQSIDVIPGKTFTATAWVADYFDSGGLGPLASRNYEIIIFDEGGSGGTFSAKFDLDNGTIDSSAATGSGVVVSANITQGPAYTNGYWWQVQVTGYFTDATITDATWINSILDGSFNRTYNGDGSSGVVVWNPLLSRGGPGTVRAEITTDATPYQLGPGDLDDVVLTLDWYEKDGAYWGQKQEFVGEVTEVRMESVGWGERGRYQRYEVECAGPARELGRARYDLAIDDGNIEDAAAAIVALVSGDGFTVSVDAGLQGTAIAGDVFGYASPVAMFDEVCRRSGSVYRTPPSKAIRLFVPGTENVLPIIDREEITGQLPAEPNAVWSRDSKQIANAVRVTGNDILVTALDAGSPYATHDAPVFNAPGMRSTTDAARVAQALLDGLKGPILDGTISTWSHEIEPGMAALVTDREWGVVEQAVNIRSVNMRRTAAGIWISDLSVTTEELLSRLGVMQPVPDDPRPGDPLPPYAIFVVNGPIPDPSAAAPTPASDEVLLHLRFVEGESAWYLEMHSGSAAAGAGADWLAQVRFQNDAALSITATAPDAEAGEGAGVVNNSTRLVTARTEDGSGKHAFWELEQNGKDTLQMVMSAVEGTVYADVFVAFDTELASITIGGQTIASNVATNQVIRLQFAADPTSPIEPAAIGTTELADDAVTTAKIAAGAVGTTELAAGAVTNPKIGAGAVDTAELAADAVTTAKIAAGAVDTTELAADAVTTAKIAAGAVGTTELGADSVTAAKIPDDAIGNEHIAANAVQAAQIANNSVGNAKMNASDPLLRDKINHAHIDGEHFDELVVDEYQTMGSTLSDGEWDTLET